MTGGTGHLGRAFVELAMREGHRVRVLSRRDGPAAPSFEHARGDLASGAGIVEAVESVDAIVHAASDPADTEAVDVGGSARLAEVAGRAGVAHLVFVSIVGIDRIPFPYYRAKLAAEEAILGSGAPCSIVRAAQFHHFVDTLLRRAARAPVVLPVPWRFSVQSIAVEDVARELLAVLSSPPAGLLPDLVGPEAMRLTEAARPWLRARRMRRVIVPIPVPGATAAGFRGGHNTAPDRPSGSVTWQEWLARRYAGAARVPGTAAR